MNGWMKPMILCVVLLFVVTPLAAVAAELKIYSMLDKVVQDEMTKYLNAEMSQAIGMPVRSLTMSTGEVWARIQAEKPRIGADLLIHVPFGVVAGMKEGLWVKYPNSPGWAGIPAKLKEPEGYYYTLGTFSFVFIGHKPSLEKKGWKTPTSYAELTDPKWKGQLLLPSPVTSGTATMILYTVMGLFNMDEEAGWKYLEQVHKNVAQYTRSGNTPVDLVARGEYLIAVAADENVPVRLKEGYPLEWVVPKEGMGTSPILVTIIRGTENLAAAQKVVDFMGTEKFQRFFANFGYLVSRENIPATLYGTRPKTIDVDVKYQAETRERLLQVWKDKFLRQ